uniref:Galectin n=1 Tax=Rhabditophanes sp. KR3021 TaxID=114890 RepID=A0AC35UBW1_9BILA
MVAIRCIKVLPLSTDLSIRNAPFKIRIVGEANKTCKRFAINLCSGKDILLHFNVRFDEKVIVRNNLLNEKWQHEERSQPFMPISIGKSYVIDLHVTATHVNCFVYGEEYCKFAFRTSADGLNNVEISGDTKIYLLSITK